MSKETVEQLQAAIETRNEKIKSVEERIERQNSHIERVQKRQSGFLDLLNRWTNQNKRDQLKIEELSVKGEKDDK